MVSLSYWLGRESFYGIFIVLWLNDELKLDARNKGAHWRGFWPMNRVWTVQATVVLIFSACWVCSP